MILTQGQITFFFPILLFRNNLGLNYCKTIQLEADTCLEDDNPNVESNQIIISWK